MEENKENKIILQFEKDEDGVSVSVHDCEVIDVLVGIAETIQLISEETDGGKESIFKDINKILEVLEKEEEK